MPVGVAIIPQGLNHAVYTGYMHLLLSVRDLICFDGMCKFTRGVSMSSYAYNVQETDTCKEIPASTHMYPILLFSCAQYLQQERNSLTAGSVF